MKKLIMIVALLITSQMTLSANGKALYGKCIGCHGANGQTKALGQSAVIKGWSKDKVAKVLKGYKAGTYGRAMKGIMKGQVASFNDKQINDISAYIASFK